MKEIPLSRGKVALVDDEDYAALAGFRWYAIEAKLKNHSIFYARRDVQVDNVRSYVSMSRVIIGALPGQLVDHENGDGCDNQKHNLRLANRLQNVVNRVRLHPANKSGYRGVSWYAAAKRWRAGLGRQGKTINLGNFLDVVDAARAYDAAAVREWGDFARLNFPVTGASQ